MGPAAQRVFSDLGIETIGAVRQLSFERLIELFGKTGERLWELAHGIDRRPVVPDRDAKSVSHETTFPSDIRDPEVLRSCLLGLAEQVACGLRRQQLCGRTVQLKLRFSDFHMITRAKTLLEPSNVTQEICDAAVELLNGGLSTSKLLVRLLGVGLSGLEPLRPRQKTLFADEVRERDTRLDAIRDQISERFGTSALQRGSGLLQSKSVEDTCEPG